MGFWYWAVIGALFPLVFTVAVVRLVVDVISGSLGG